MRGVLNMKFVTVMDMWLLLMNGVLLGAILYYGRKLITLVARAVNNVDQVTVGQAVLDERKRVCKIIEQELSTFKMATSMGDIQSDAIVQELETILKMVSVVK